MARFKIGLALAVGLAFVALAVLLSHRWGKEGGLDPVFVILALAIVALAFPATRIWLAKATNLKLPGGIEITREVQDAVAEASLLPLLDEEADTNSYRILTDDWRGDPAAALGKLQGKLGKRLDWLEREIYGSKKKTNSETIAKLRRDRLLRSFEASLVNAVNEVTGRMVLRDFDAGGETKETMIRFIEEADRVVHQCRLIAMDRLIRKHLVDRGLKILDIGGQPRGRWPDFYVYDPWELNRPALRIAVRMALTKDSELIDKTRGRLKRKWPETPFDLQTKRVIVFPETSLAEAETSEEIPALKREAFFAWLEDYLRD